MSLNLNRIDGIIGIFFLGTATACFPAFMVFAITNIGFALYGSCLGLAARIFAIIGGILFVSGLVLLVINRMQSEKRPHAIIDTVVSLLAFMAISTVIVRTILTLTLGSISIYT